MRYLASYTVYLCGKQWTLSRLTTAWPACLYVLLVVEALAGPGVGGGGEVHLR